MGKARRVKLYLLQQSGSNSFLVAGGGGEGDTNTSTHHHQQQQHKYKVNIGPQVQYRLSIAESSLHGYMHYAEINKS